MGTDGSRSFVGLFYADEMIEWMTGDADGGVNGLGGDRADVGFVSEISANSYFLPVSNTSAVLMLDSLSNVGLGGVWLFRIDQDMIIRPSMSSINKTRRRVSTCTCTGIILLVIAYILL